MLLRVLFLSTMIIVMMMMMMMIIIMMRMIARVLSLSAETSWPPRLPRQLNPLW